MGNGSFDARPGFGIFLSVGSASGTGFNWPSWLPIKIHALGIEWDDFDETPEDFLITLSASITGLPAVAGLEFEGIIEGVKISPTLLLAGKFPIVDIASIGVSVKGNVFGGQLEATLIGGIIKFSESGALIDQFDRTTPVADRVFFIGIQGGFSLAGLGGLTIQFALSELGPLGVLISASVPGGILLEPNTGLSINDFTAGVEFFKTLPTITDPFELRNPAFGSPTDLSPDQWLASVKQQVVTQFNLVKANPEMSGFEATFTSPMTITGSAKLFSIYLSKEAFNGEILIKISTDGKFLISGKLNFAADNLSLSAKLYADLSNVAEGDVTVLFLADIPDQVRLLTIHGKLQMGFGPSGGSLNVVDDAEEATTVAEAPTANLIDPAAGRVDVGRVNSAAHSFNGKNYIDVEFRASSGSSLDYDSIFDAGQEITVTAGGQSVAVTGVPVPIITEVSADGMLTTVELVPNAGESLADAIRRTGTSRFRYTIEQNGYEFDLGTVNVTFVAGEFSSASTTLESGTVLDGLANEVATSTFVVDGATATLLDPGANGGIDITALNERGYIDVRFEPSAGATLDEASITDTSTEFELIGDGASNVVIDGGATLVDGTTFRYTFSGAFTSGVITAQFLENRWMDSGHSNGAFDQTFEVRGATADVVVPSVGGSIGVDEINNLAYLEVRFQGTQDAAIDHSTIDGDELILRDSEGNEVALGAIPTRIAGTDKYRYEILDTLTIGTYTVEFVVGSFSDTATVPNINLVEFESFMVEQATASLSDPLPGDVIDREVLNERNYIDIEFTPVRGTVLDGDSITDSGQEFELNGADGQNLIIDGAATLVEGNVYRYTFTGSLNTGELTIRFLAGSWNDCREVVDSDGVVLSCDDANQGVESTETTEIITQSESFFIEISGGILLQSAGLFDEPLIELTVRARIEIDAVREVFSLDFSGELAIIKLGVVGATAGRFILSTGDTPSGNPEFWGVMTVETNFVELEQYGIFLFANGTLQINLTSVEKTETLTLRGLGDNNEDVTREFVLPAASFALEVVGDASVRVPGSDTDLVSLQGAFYIGIDPTGFTIYATASLKFGAGDTALTYGETTGLIIVKSGFVREEDENGTASFRFAPAEAGLGIAASFTVGASAGLGIPGVGSIFSVSGSVNITLNTTLKDQSFDIPVSFHRLLDDGEPTTLNIFKARPSLNGLERAGAAAEIYVVATIKAKLTFLDSFTLEGFVQLAVGVAPSTAQATFSLTGAVTGELGFLGAVSGTLNLIVYVGAKNGVVGRIQLGLDVGLGDLLEIEGDLVLEVNAVASFDGGPQLFNDEEVETFLIGDDGKFVRDAAGNFETGTVIVKPGVKLEVSGKVVIAKLLTLEGRFSFIISPEKFEVTVEARLVLEPFGSLEVSGGLRIDSAGLVLRASLALDAAFGGDLGISFSGSAYLAVNRLFGYEVG